MSVGIKAEQSIQEKINLLTKNKDGNSSKKTRNLKAGASIIKEIYALGIST